MKKYFILLLLFIPFRVYSLDFPNTNSKVVEIYDLTDNIVLYENNSSKVTSIASLTKIVTTITAIENFKDLDKEVTITSFMIDSVDPVASKAGLNVGDKLTIRDLLYASMLPSGADATNALAILSCGTPDCFVSKMNQLANRLNLKNTNFKNVTGLDEDGHKSTATDMRKLLVYALKNDEFRKIFTTKEYTLSNGLKVKTTLFRYGGEIDAKSIMGSKTGYTIDAGYCLSSLNNVNGHEMIITVLNAEKLDNKFYNIIDTKTLLEFLRMNYQEQILVKKDSIIKTIPVKLSKIDKYDIKTTDNVTKYLPSDYDKNKVSYEYTGKNKISFLTKKGSNIGTIKYYYNNELIKKEDILLDQDIKINIIKLLLRYIYIPIIITLLFIIKKRRH